LRSIRPAWSELAIASPVKVRHSRMLLAVVRLGSPQANN
jgi:hypothetical protein